VTQINGNFGRGDLVAIVDPAGTQLGQGLVRYTSAEARQIMGRKSAEIADLLGYEGRAALVHRDDMVL
jgi:glutamate 5-kinase